MKKGFYMEILATTYRGDVKDLFTYGTLVLMDSSGNKIYEKGDGKEYAYPRSSAKFMQAMVPVSLGVAEKYNFTDAEISQICASHSGEEIHIKTVRGILEKIGLDESYLQCGVHYPIKEDVTNNMIRNDIPATEIHNNCSGKHSGMLAAALMLGERTDNYWQPENEVQKRITTMISRICEIPEDEIKMSIDGCSVPVHSLPIEKFAYGMARVGDYKSLPEDLQIPAKRVVDAMYNEPIYASGSDRIDYHIMDRATEKIVVKSGANGYFCGALPERKQGFALKCYQAASIYKNRVLIDFLKKLGVIAEKDYEFFDTLEDNKVYNHRKMIVGRIETNL